MYHLLKANLEAGALAWSPVDNDWVAYNNWGTGRDGLWLLQVNTGKQYKLASGFIGAFTWSPDGSQIVALREPESQGTERRERLCRSKSNLNQFVILIRYLRDPSGEEADCRA